MTTLHIPTDTEIETYTGRYFDFDDPQPAVVCKEDVAHALANICRFTGHVYRYYSVAEHAVMASDYARHMKWSKDQILACFHHDDAEAYLGDIVRPFKHLLGDTLRDIEAKIDAAICEAFNLPFGPDEFHKPYVKEADNWCLMSEARQLLPSKGEAWSNQTHNWSSDLEEVDGPDVAELGLEPAEAERLYLYSLDIVERL